MTESFFRMISSCAIATVWFHKINVKNKMILQLISVVFTSEKDLGKTDIYKYFHVNPGYSQNAGLTNALNLINECTNSN